MKFNSEFVEKKLMKRLSRTVTALSEFEDSQAAFYLLRVSYSIVQNSALHADHATGALAGPRQELRQADAQGGGDHPRHSPEHSYKQSCVTPKLGGMGMRKVEEHAEMWPFMRAGTRLA